MSPKELQFISPEQASVVLGENAITLEGLSMILYDTQQFMPVCLIPLPRTRLIYLTALLPLVGGDHLGRMAGIFIPSYAPGRTKNLTFSIADLISGEASSSYHAHISA